jgi:hypothetical protein
MTKYLTLILLFAAAPSSFADTRKECVKAVQVAEQKLDDVFDDLLAKSGLKPSDEAALENNAKKVMDLCRKVERSISEHEVYDASIRQCGISARCELEALLVTFRPKPKK